MEDKNKKPKEILVISGKGGTGKTTIATALAFFINKNDIIIDCDVDAPNTYIILDSDFNNKHDFYLGKECEIDSSICSMCGICQSKCVFDAIHIIDDKMVIDNLECENCLLCYHLCPNNAIKVEDDLCGEYYIANTRLNKTLIHAQLYPGADNSGRLVTKLREIGKDLALKKQSEIILIDGPPGIGCPVIASITNVDYVVFVTEPTLSAYSDLERLSKVVIEHFNIKSGVIINKYDLNKEIAKKIEEFCNKHNIKILGSFPYLSKFYEAITQKKNIIEIDSKLKDDFYKIYQNILKEVI